MDRSIRYLGGTLLILFVVALWAVPRETLSQASSSITGFLWSDTIGWVSTNCADLGTCATSNYGLTIASDGTISGYAWSEHIGWISAQSSDLTGCPTAPCTARMEEYAMKGWLKALSANDAQSGGWDGFISLNGSNYGPTLGSDGMFSGYAWGDMNVGWLSFATSYDAAETTWQPTCSTQYVCTDATHRQNACTNAPIEACEGSFMCASGACVLPPAPHTSDSDKLTITPNLIRAGGSAAISWTVSDATSCTVTENSPSLNDTWSATSSAAASCTHSGSACRSGAIVGAVTYTLYCTGPGGDLTQTATVSNNPIWNEI